MSKAQAATPKAAPNAPPSEKPELKLNRRWFGLVPAKCDRSYEGLIRAIRAVLVDLGGVDFNSPDQMCDSLAEAIRKQLNAPAYSVEVGWAGTRRSTKAARLIVTTVWGLREDVEGALSFRLFSSTT